MRIAYLGAFPYPGSTAATHRVRGVASALTLAGHSVLVVPTVASSATIEAGAVQVDQELARDVTRDRVRSAARLLGGDGRVLSWLSDHREEVDLAILYGTSAGLLARYLGMQAVHVSLPPVALDVVEWYEYAHRPGGRFGPFAAEHALAMRSLAPRVGHCICISRFLAEYFEQKGSQTVLVPPLFDSQSLPDALRGEIDPHLVHVGYAGSPGAKDGPGLHNLLVAVNHLTAPQRARLQVHVIGLSESQARSTLGSADLLRSGGSVQWHGRVDAAAAQSLVAAMDFSFLQRPQRRYAMAGFPTKVVESLVLGTPVITNLTSDLGLYLRDGVNGVILSDGTSPEAVGAALERVLSTDFELGWDRAQVRDDARAAFNPARFVEALDHFAISAAGRATR